MILAGGRYSFITYLDETMGAIGFRCLLSVDENDTQ